MGFCDKRKTGSEVKQRAKFSMVCNKQPLGWIDYMLLNTPKSNVLGMRLKKELA